MKEHARLARATELAGVLRRGKSMVQAQKRVWLAEVSLGSSLGGMRSLTMLDLSPYPSSCVARTPQQHLGDYEEMWQQKAAAAAAAAAATAAAAANSAAAATATVPPCTTSGSGGRPLEGRHASFPDESWQQQEAVDGDGGEPMRGPQRLSKKISIRLGNYDESRLSVVSLRAGYRGEALGDEQPRG